MDSMYSKEVVKCQNKLSGTNPLLYKCFCLVKQESVLWILTLEIF